MRCGPPLRRKHACRRRPPKQRTTYGWGSIAHDARRTLLMKPPAKRTVATRQSGSTSCHRKRWKEHCASRARQLRCHIVSDLPLRTRTTRTHHTHTSEPVVADEQYRHLRHIFAPLHRRVRCPSSAHAAPFLYLTLSVSAASLAPHAHPPSARLGRSSPRTSSCGKGSDGSARAGHTVSASG